MKQYLLTLLLTLTVFNLSAQSDSLTENTMIKTIQTCEEVISNATTLLPELHRKSDTKVIDDILVNWRRTCGVTTPYFSFKVLYDIEHNFFFKLPSLVSRMKEYKRAVGMKVDTRTFRQDSVNRHVHDSFYSFIKSWSRRLSEQDVSRTPLERFLLRFYANPSDSLVATLEDDKDHYSGLHDDYVNDKNDKEPHVYQPRIIATLATGVWIPSGELALVGKHPFVGFQLGFASNRTRYFIDVHIRFLNSPNDYYIPKEDSLYRTNHFFGGYVCAGMTYEVFRRNNQSLDVQAGIGIDGFDAIAIKGNSDKPAVAKTLSSLTINGGLGYKFYFGEYTAVEYCGLDIRYHYLNYKNKGGSPLTGGAIVIALVFGFNNL